MLSVYGGKKTETWLIISPITHIKIPVYNVTTCYFVPIKPSMQSLNLNQRARKSHVLR